MKEAIELAEKRVKELEYFVELMPLPKSFTTQFSSQSRLSEAKAILKMLKEAEKIVIVTIES